MVTASSIFGSSDFGSMVCVSPWMWKCIASFPGVALEASIASRRVHPLALQMPLPGSAVLVTVKVVAARAGMATSTTMEAAANTARNNKAPVLALSSTHMPLLIAMLLTLPCSIVGRSAEAFARPDAHATNSICLRADERISKWTIFVTFLSNSLTWMVQEADT